MKAKKIYESLDDILKPKSEKDINQYLNDTYDLNNDELLIKIVKWLILNDVYNFTINEDYSIDVLNDILHDDITNTFNSFEKYIMDGRVDIPFYKYSELPEFINFNIVEGYFSMTKGNLETLRGFPNKVYGNFWCSHNKLDSLKGCPNEVLGSFICHHNNVKFEKDYILSLCDTQKSKIQN